MREYEMREQPAYDPLPEKASILHEGELDKGKLFLHNKRYIEKDQPEKVGGMISLHVLNPKLIYSLTKDESLEERIVPLELLFLKPTRAFFHEGIDDANYARLADIFVLPATRMGLVTDGERYGFFSQLVATPKNRGLDLMIINNYAADMMHCQGRLSIIAGKRGLTKTYVFERSDWHGLIYAFGTREVNSISGGAYKINSLKKEDIERSEDDKGVRLSLKNGRFPFSLERGIPVIDMASLNPEQIKKLFNPAPFTIGEYSDFCRTFSSFLQGMEMVMAAEILERNVYVKGTGTIKLKMKNATGDGPLDLEVHDGTKFFMPKDWNTRKQRGALDNKTADVVVVQQTPTMIKHYLDEYVVGQEVAKEKIATIAHRHLLRLERDTADKDIALLFGPSGSGKTYVAHCLARILGLPFVEWDSSAMTEAGYVGDKPKDIILRLLNETHGDRERAQQGVVFLDEMDKMRQATGGGGRDVRGNAQHALLKFMEGARYVVEHDRKDVEFDTAKVLFLCGGAFTSQSGLPSLEDLANKNLIGFESRKVTETHPLVQYGFIEELAGRFTALIPFTKLSGEDFVHILTDSKEAILAEFVRDFQQSSVQLSFEDDAVKSIAKMAQESPFGARALKKLVRDILDPYAFNIDRYRGSSLIITKDMLGLKKQ